MGLSLKPLVTTEEVEGEACSKLLVTEEEEMGASLKSLVTVEEAGACLEPWQRGGGIGAILKGIGNSGGAGGWEEEKAGLSVKPLETVKKEAEAGYG